MTTTTIMRLASITETPGIEDTIFRLLSSTFCIIGKPDLVSILAINISTGDCIRLSITIDLLHQHHALTLTGKGFVARLLPVDSSLFNELDISNKSLSLPAQAKRKAIPGLRSSLNVLVLPNLVPATIHALYNEVPPPSRLETMNAKNGSIILTDSQHKERLYSFSISPRPSPLSSSSTTTSLSSSSSSSSSRQTLDYARVVVSREKLKQVMHSATEARRISDNNDNDDDQFDEGGFNVESDEDDDETDGPTSIIPLQCLIQDIIVLRSSTRLRGKSISEKVIRDITEHCKTLGWEMMQETIPEADESSLSTINTLSLDASITMTTTTHAPVEGGVVIGAFPPSPLLILPAPPIQSKVLSKHRVSLPSLPGNGWPGATATTASSGGGFMSARIVATFQQTEKLAADSSVKAKNSEKDDEEKSEKVKPRQSWISSLKKPVSSSSSSSSSSTESFLSSYLSQSWLSHRNESAASSRQLEALCSSLLGSQSAADTFDDVDNIDASLAVLSTRAPKPLAIRFRTLDDAAREKEEREGREMAQGGPGIMDADLTSNTTAADRNKLLASMNLLEGVDKSGAGGESGAGGKKKPATKRQPSAKTSAKSAKCAKITVEGEATAGIESPPIVVKDLVALASAVTLIVNEAHGDKAALEKELTSKRVNVDQLKAYAKTVAKVAVGGAKAVLVTRILAKIMP